MTIAGRRSVRRAGARRLRRHRLLRRGLERTRGLRLRPQSLDRGRDVGLLGDHRVADLLGPFELAVHHRQDLREGDQRRDAGVPALVLDGSQRGIAREIGIVLGPARRLDDFQRIGRRHQDLRQQRIGIERDRRQELVELSRREGLAGIRGSGLRLSRGRRRCLRCRPTADAGDKECHGHGNPFASLHVYPLARVARLSRMRRRRDPRGVLPRGPDRESARRCGTAIGPCRSRIGQDCRHAASAGGP